MVAMETFRHRIVELRRMDLEVQATAKGRWKTLALEMKHFSERGSWQRSCLYSVLQTEKVERATEMPMLVFSFQLPFRKLCYCVTNS